MNAVQTQVPAREPVRMCVVCRQRRPQSELMRIARAPEGPRFDPAQKRPGRGAYLCPDPTCVERARQSGVKAMRRALRGGTDQEVMRALDDVEAAAPKEHEA